MYKISRKKKIKGLLKENKRIKNEIKEKCQTQIINTQQIARKIAMFKNHQKFKNIKGRVIDYFNKNYLNIYREDFGFHEQWQKIKKQGELINQVFYQNTSYNIFIALLIILINTAAVWYRSITFFYHNEFQETYLPVFYFCFFVQIIDIIIKIYELKKRHVLNINLNLIFTKTWKNIFALIYMTFCIFSLVQKDHVIKILFQIVCLYNLYYRASELYQTLRLKTIVLLYETQFKIFDLVVSLVIIAHFFAILLYLAGISQPGKTWISQRGLSHQNEFVVYLNSFYFCTTTILTVGYGDITPQNSAEIIVVLIVQILGIIMFGYTINQIGYTLSLHRKSRETLEKDLRTLEKMQKYYKIQDSLMEKSRNYLIQQCDQIFDQLLPEQENFLMMKFNEDLRNNIYMENSLSVIKSSIFFLCRWSKYFQNAISINLSQTLLPPEQFLYQPKGEERIYIIQLGKINLISDKKSIKSQTETLLKTIQINNEKQVNSNCYGYSYALSERELTFRAIAKKSTSCYYISKEKFFSCVKQRQIDFQYYHQLRCQIQQCKVIQSFECPIITTGKHNYSPTISNLVRRYNMNSTETSHRKGCSRRKANRENTNQRLLGDQGVAKKMREIIGSSDEILEDTEQDEIVITQSGPVTGNAGKALKTVKSKQQQSIKKKTFAISKRFCEGQDLLAQIPVDQISQHFAYYFQHGRQYQSYYSNSNRQSVIKRVQIYNPVKAKMSVFLPQIS